LLYKSGQVAELYVTTTETLRNWSKIFGAYLSTTAQANTGKQRLYNRDDMTVISLVAEMRIDSLSYREIQIALKNGQRGQPPELDPDELRALRKDIDKITEPETLQGLLARSQEALEITQRQLIELQQIKEKTIQLETSLGHVTNERNQLKKEVKQLTKRIEDVSRETGEIYAKGYVDGFERGKKTED